MAEFKFEDLGYLEAAKFPNPERIALDADEGDTIVQTTILKRDEQGRR